MHDYYLYLTASKWIYE